MFQSVSLSSRAGTPDALVVGVFQGEALDPRSRQLDPDGMIGLAAKRKDCTGEAGRVVEAFPGSKGRAARVLILGLGKRESFKPGQLRSLLGAVGRRLAVTKDQDVLLALEHALGAVDADAEQCGRAAGEGLGLIAWHADQFKGKGHDPKRLPLRVRSASRAFAAGLGRGLALAASANFTRTLSETPPNIATTGYIADQARKLARQTGLSCRVFEERDLERERLVGLLNVGKASENRPRMIRLEYRPRDGRGGEKPIVLVGKTMTYDSGGLSLKINNGMVGMKRDKDGGCAVLGAMHAIATVVKPRRRVVALLSVAENSISDEAYRPDDVIRYRNGVTVEVTNTDAEGRLVLADALIWACEKENPQYIVDLATLTGGVVVALGSTFCGMFCENDKLRGKIEAASEASGERVWRLPMHDEYRDMMKSPVADILNSNPNRKAHPVQGAAFLSYFVEKNVPWCHLDIAGVHEADSDAGCFRKGPTGWGARLLAELLDRE
ncbi:MAG: leucyl aminopeptidase family protein [Phycisphaerae bacterium]|nr:leucyl aminopeptidase family protein [Phycisphaerae bacterium]